jgi:hypothetical protein
MNDIADEPEGCNDPSILESLSKISTTCQKKRYGASLAVSAAEFNRALIVDSRCAMLLQQPDGC